MEISLEDLAAMLGGHVEGDAQARVGNIAPIDKAGSGDLTFLSNPKYASYLATTAATAVLVHTDQQAPATMQAYLVRVPDVYAAFTQLLAYYESQTRPAPKTGVESPAYVDETAQLAKDAYIGAFAYVGPGVVVGPGAQIHPHVYLGEGTQVGARSTLYSGAKVYARTSIGSDCIVHSGAVIGSDGFGFAPRADGAYDKIPQLGRVVLHDGVEIGANTTVDRATMEETTLREGVKLDNLVQIAHNVEIGAHTVIASQAGISGSTQVGPYCVIGGQAGFSGHIKIAERNSFAARSGLNKSIPQMGGQWFGAPVMPVRQAFKVNAVYRNLPELQSRVRELEAQLRALQQDHEK